MSDWNYDRYLNDLELSTVCSHTRWETYGGNSRFDSGLEVPGRDGVTIDPEAPYGPLTLLLRTVIRYTDEDGQITHPDGEAGHLFANLAALELEFGRDVVTVKEDRPNAGPIEVDVRLFADPIREDRFVFLWPLSGYRGAWRTVDVTTVSGNPPVVTTSGVRRVDDPTLVFSAPGVFELTSKSGVKYTITASAGPDYPVTVNVGGQHGEGTVVDDSEVDASGSVVFSHRAWLRLDPRHTHAVTSTVSCSLSWRDRWV